MAEEVKCSESCGLRNRIILAELNLAKQEAEHYSKLYKEGLKEIAKEQLKKVTAQLLLEKKTNKLEYLERFFKIGLCRRIQSIINYIKQ